MGTELQFGMMENFWWWVVVSVAQQYEDTNVTKLYTQKALTQEILHYVYFTTVQNNDTFLTGQFQTLNEVVSVIMYQGWYLVKLVWNE